MYLALFISYMFDIMRTVAIPALSCFINTCNQRNTMDTFPVNLCYIIMTEVAIRFLRLGNIRRMIIEMMRDVIMTVGTQQLVMN